MRPWNVVGGTALALVSTAMWPIHPATASTAASQAPCGTFSGPAWSYVDPMQRPPLQTGTSWKVIAKGVPCSFASTWARKLVKTPFRGEAATKLASPKGWTCIAGGGLTGGGKGTPGSCSQGPKSFAWGGARPA
jgi:hypothetical protein